MGTRTFILCSLMLSPLAFGAEPIPRGAAEVQELLSAIAASALQVRDYTAVLVKRERIGERLLPQVTMVTKWARPYKIYLKNIAEPQAGREILYVRGRHDDEIIAHKGSFPDITVRLDPLGTTAMGENHHPIGQAGLLDLTNLVQDCIRQALEEEDGAVSLVGPDTLWGRPCTKLEITGKGGGTFHTAAKGETLWDVARRYQKSMYLLLHANAEKEWDEADDLSAGERVFIPRFYASKFVVWLDDQTKLPVKALIYDHAGRLYESYEHRDLKINVGLTDRDFDPENQAYQF